MKKIALLVMLVIFSLGIEIGSIVPKVVLDKKDGGLVSGGAFDLSSLRGKVYLLVYSDPDKRDLNEEFFEKVKAKNFDRSKYGSVAIINMAATWMPNFLLNAILKKKQKKFP
ncbi:hypothetical protein [Nitratiruptor tergarcus]|uniref:hypothetical protein n=1 Tax=Nitratiruptor tergarcus TaxID=269259 RepID=UPI0009FEE204|nr:hypothetical protein [Nitratiruptor tergarcus]